MARHTDQRTGSSAGECRRCRTFCDKLVKPGSCLEMGCRFLYSYEDQASGRTFVGCLHKVFRAEIDLDLLRAAERSPHGFGGVKMTGVPLPHCPFTVEPSFEGEGPDHECVNPRFYDCTEEGDLGLRVVDLRDVLL